MAKTIGLTFNKSKQNGKGDNNKNNANANDKSKQNGKGDSE